MSMNLDYFLREKGYGVFSIHCALKKITLDSFALPLVCRSFRFHLRRDDDMYAMTREGGLFFSRANDRYAREVFAATIAQHLRCRFHKPR